MPSAARTVDRESTAFLGIVALVMAMPASSIDLLLPTFPDMREALGLAPGSTEVARVITSFFLGLALGQLVYGPLSDRYGRKPVLYAGLAVFVVGAAGSVAAPSLGALVAWRALWGFGAAAPRSLAMAIVRDSFEGDRMARAMSLIMAIFILVPVVAPSVGAGVLQVASWRVVLGVPIGVAAVVAVLLVRMPETLAPADRRTLDRRGLGEALRIVVTSRTTVTHGLAATCLFGVMVGFIGTVEATIDQVFHASGSFPLLFGGLAGCMAVGSLLSARLVVRVGIARLLRLLSVAVVGAAALHTAVVVLADGRPPLWAWLLTMALLLPSLMMLLPNTNTAAMAPLGEVAGMGAAILGAVMTGGGALLGAVVDSVFDGTAAPFGVCALAFTATAAVLLAVGRAPAGTTVPTVVVADA
jgi:DHA1 family bicyclomycin/chloramphenicol resistance-like MFS transporter